MRTKLLLVAVMGLAGGLAIRAEALDPKDLSALQAAVHEMCVQPDRKGDYLKIDGDLDAGATLRVVGVQASGKITKEIWNGINQRLDQYKTDPRECAVSIVKLLAPLLNGPTQSGDCSIFGNNNNNNTMNCPNYFSPQPRTINDAAAMAIEQGARSAGPHNFAVWLTGNDPDVSPYSGRLISILNKGGWTGNIAGMTGMSFPPPQDVGLHLCGKLPTPSESATTLLRILRRNDQDVSLIYGICKNFGADFDANFLKFDDDSVGIIIGRNGPSNP